VDRFAPGDSADPRYGELFRTALAAGVEVLPCRYVFRQDAVTWLGTTPVQTHDVSDGPPASH
jgi:sugar fermentation stimulation protein A